MVPLQLKLKGTNITTWALLDTGATSNFISSTLAKQLEIPFSAMASVQIGDGTVVKTQTLGEEVSFSLDSVNFTAQFLAMSNLSFPVILGTPWWEKARCNIDWDTKHAIFHQNGKTGLVQLLSDQSAAMKPWLHKIENTDSTPLPSAKGTLPDYLKVWAHVFNKEECSCLPERRDCNLRIDLLLGTTPSWGKVFPVTQAQGKYLKEYLAENVEKGFMRRSNSPCSSPIFFVKKSDGGQRPCVDYSNINAITIKNQYPVPSVEQLTNNLTGARHFTKLDLRSAYHQIRIAEGHEWKTAVRTPFGLYKYLVMPFGLCNAPAAFQSFMNEVLFKFLGILVVVYLDNILIYSKDEASHAQHVKEVLERLKEFNLFCKLEKCEFNVTEVEFLRYQVKEGGFAITPSKVQAVLDWPIPSTRTRLRGFLGLANFCRKFIKNFSKIALPLTDLTLEAVPYKWNQQADDAFMALKHAFTTAPVLIRPDASKQFFLETDASNFAYGAVLLQEGEDGLAHPVAYFSSKMIDAERNYMVYIKELLAIVKALDHWRRYLEGSTHPVIIRTNHKNLLYFAESRKITQRHARWALDLTNYDFRIDYKPGRLNTGPDALSRREDHGKD